MAVNKSWDLAWHQWALCDVWPLREAAMLVVGDDPRELGADDETVEPSKEARAVYELALNCAGHSLAVEESQARGGELVVEPLTFVDWVSQRRGSVADGLRDLLLEARRAVEVRQGSYRPNMTPAQRHRERVRGIGAYLWDQDPSIRIGEMAQREALQRIGCEGSSYRDQTMRDWLKEVAPEDARRGGRPRRS